VGKRPFHAFISHAHVDRDRADEIAHWLEDVAGVAVWYDAVNLPPGARIQQALPAAIEASRAMVLLLSEASVTRGWVEQEYGAAIDHQTLHPGFRIIPVRLDVVEPPGFLKNYSHMTLGPEGLDAAAAAGILKALYQPATPIILAGGRNTYVSRGWHRDDGALAEAVCGALEAAGLQLIGDAEDQPSWVEERVARIMQGCGAVAAVLPYRPQSPSTTSKYVLREWEIALGLGLPCLVIADERVVLPAEVANRPGLVGPAAIDDAGLLEAAADALAEDWALPKTPPYAFYATDFGDDLEPARTAVKELVEVVTALPCVLGEYVKAEPVQRQILAQVAAASFVIADISGDSPNVYVEIGAARASGVPVYLMRQGPPGRPPFMLRDQQVWDYRSDAELLGRVIRVAYPHRRTLLARAGRR
jgi:hypothetical protein